MVKHIENSDICLGVFGDSRKTENVISNFLVTACRLGKIIITLKTEAAKEVFKYNPSCFLINKPASINLAKKILEIVKNIYLIKNKTSSKILYNNYFSTLTQKELL